MTEKYAVPELYVADTAEFTERECKIVVQEGLEIGVFLVDGEFYAYENYCVHQGGPVCQGRIFRKVEENLAEDKTSRGRKFSEDQIHIVCPWHGYEYNIKTGMHPADRRLRLKKYEVKLRGSEVYVVVGEEAG